MQGREEWINWLEGFSCKHANEALNTALGLVIASGSCRWDSDPPRLAVGSARTVTPDVARYQGSRGSIPISWAPG